jgi:hypothetical protein
LISRVEQELAPLNLTGLTFFVLIALKSLVHRSGSVGDRR